MVWTLKMMVGRMTLSIVLKTTAFSPAAMIKYLFAKDVLGLILEIHSILKGFRILKSGNFLSSSELSEEVLESLLSMLEMLLFTYDKNIKAQNILIWYSTQMLKISK